MHGETETMTKEEKQIIELRKELRELHRQSNILKGNYEFYR